MGILSHLAIVVFVCGVSLAQDSSREARQPVAAASRSTNRDSARAASSDSAYRQLLERTNQQLSLSWTPMGTFIAALGVLFTVAAIAAAFLLYYQSRDYSQRIEDSIRKHGATIDRLVSERAAEMQVHLLARLDEEHAKMARLTQAEKESIMVALEEGATEAEHRKLTDNLLAARLKDWEKERQDAEANIQRIEAALDTLVNRVQSPKAMIGRPPYSIFNPERRIVPVKCAGCGINFKIQLPLPEPGADSRQLVIPCPKCGAENHHLEHLPAAPIDRRWDDAGKATG